MDATSLVSERGSPLLSLEGYTYSKKKVLKSGETFWTCTVRTCNAKIFTFGENSTRVTRSNAEHDHSSNNKMINRKVLSAAAKRKAVDNLSERPSKILHAAIKDNQDVLQTLSEHDLSCIKRNVYNSRRKTMPPLPGSADDVIQVLENLNLKTIENEEFLFINNSEHRIVVFSCKTNIMFMCDSDKLFVDGTFDYCTKFFLQLFTLHVIKNGHYVPVAFCLLPDKSETTYKLLFALVKEKCNSLDFNLEPKSIVVDYEIAIHNAILAQWPTTNIVGCRFHLGQSWFRKIQKLGLAKEYKEDNSELGKWMRYLFGLSFLNPEEVGDCFGIDFAAFQPEDGRIKKLADYLVDNYISENAKFSPDMWAEALPTGEHTTNACESFHSRFNSNFYTTHPSLYKFIEVIQNFQTDTYIKMRSIEEPRKIQNQKVRRRFEIISKKMNDYKIGVITRLDFVKSISNNYLPK